MAPRRQQLCDCIADITPLLLATYQLRPFLPEPITMELPRKQLYTANSRSAMRATHQLRPFSSSQGLSSISTRLLAVAAAVVAVEGVAPLSSAKATYTHVDTGRVGTVSYRQTHASPLSERRSFSHARRR